MKFIREVGEDHLDLNNIVCISREDLSPCFGAADPHSRNVTMPGDCRDTEACNGLPFNSHSSGGSHGELISVYSIMKAIRVCPVCPVCGDSSHPRLARSSPHLFSVLIPLPSLYSTHENGTGARERKKAGERREREID